MRCSFSALLLLFVAACSGQAIDSMHVFRRVPTAAHTSASANALAWKLHQEQAAHITLAGAELNAVREAMAHYRPVPHRSGPIPDLGHLAIVFSHGRPMAMGSTGDLDRLINFTARKEYHISTMAEHIKVRAILMELMLLH
jgi:hypothetical protein